LASTSSIVPSSNPNVVLKSFGSNGTSISSLGEPPTNCLSVFQSPPHCFTFLANFITCKAIELAVPCSPLLFA